MTVAIAAVRAAFPELTIDDPPLGSGTFKVAFRVQRDGHELVLKVVKSPLDEEDAVLPERLRREIEAMRAVSSPNVVEVIEGPSIKPIGDENHIWYLEPYYGNGTLDKRLQSPWSEGEVIRLLKELLTGVEALWNQGRLVHRDIKPANIAFDADGRAVLLDLGIALHVDLTPITEELGLSPRTPIYAAPEQFDIKRDADVDFRTDLFLIGIVCFQVLTGVHPFRPDMPNDYFKRLSDGEYDDETLTACQVSDKLKNMLVRLLGAKPNQRYRKIEYALEAAEELTS